MNYLELNELVVNIVYECVLYDGSELQAKYLGEGLFEVDNYVYSVYGDIRYVLRISNGQNKYS